MTDDGDNLHDLLNQLHALELPGDNSKQDREQGESKDDVEEPGFENNQDYVGYDFTDRSTASQQDYLDYGRIINQSLKAYSIPYPYTGPIDFNFKNVPSRVRIVNTILDLLNQRQQSKEFIVEAQEVIRKLGVAKRDVKQRTQTVLKECNAQEAKIKDLSSELRNKDAKLQRKMADLHDKLEEISREKQSFEFRAKQNITENKKKNKIIQELGNRAKSLMNVQEARMTLGLRSINEDRIFRKDRPSINQMNKRDLNELLKEELQYKKQQIEYFTNENQHIRHDLMTLRQEVTKTLSLFGGAHDDGLYEDMSVRGFEVGSKGGGMPSVKAGGRKNQGKRKSEANKIVEGKRPQNSYSNSAGEDNEGPLPAQLDNISSVLQPGSERKSQPALSQFDSIGNIGEIDLSFENFIANESNPLRNFGDAPSTNIEDFVVDMSGLDSILDKDFNEYENMSFD